MGISLDEFYYLARQCNYRVNILGGQVTDEMIEEAMQRLGEARVARLEAVKDVPSKDWPGLSLPRLDGKGNLKPGTNKEAVCQAFQRLFWYIRRILSE
jgi:Arc/MetJ family transcription regulator